MGLSEQDLESQRLEMLSEKGYDDDSYASSVTDDGLEKPSATVVVSAMPRDGIVDSSSSKASFLTWTMVNTLATIGIVFTNKAIFDDPSFKLMQTSFACFHFLCTTLTLFILSRSSLGFFQPRRAGFLEIAPLAMAMCLNVILPNLSLAYSSVTFYQIVRILLTPLVAFINLMFYGVTIPRSAAYALVPICMGVGIVSYYDTLPDPSQPVKTTSTSGMVFAFTGVAASSVYTVWIGAYHRKLNMSSMQLLFNQAPVSSFLLLYFIPFIDRFPVWTDVSVNKYLLILLSGCFASLINLSQFFIVAGAGAVSSTVVGHAKTCSIVMLGWITSGRKVTDRSLLGVLMAIFGIIAYSGAVARAKQGHKK